MKTIKEDVYAAEYQIKKWVDKVTGQTRTRRIRPNRITFANNLLQGTKPLVDLGDEGSPYLYKVPVFKKSPTAKAVLSKERAAARRAARKAVKEDLQHQERESSMNELRELAEQAAELSLVAEQAYFLCLDDYDELYIAEEYNDEVIATYVDGQLLVADGMQLDEDIIDALDVQFIQE